MHDTGIKISFTIFHECFRVPCRTTSQTHYKVRVSAACRYVAQRRQSNYKLVVQIH